MTQPANAPPIVHIPEAEGAGLKHLVSGAEHEVPEICTPQLPVTAEGVLAGAETPLNSHLLTCYHYVSYY